MNFENLCCEYSIQAPYRTALKFTEHHNTFLEIITENIPFFFRLYWFKWLRGYAVSFALYPVK